MGHTTSSPSKKSQELHPRVYTSSTQIQEMIRYSGPHLIEWALRAKYIDHDILDIRRVDPVIKQNQWQIIQKYVLVYRGIEWLASTAQHLNKQAHLHATLKLFKEKQADYPNLVIQEELIEQTKSALDQSIAYWDGCRYVVDWMIDDYLLHVEAYKNEEKCKEVTDESQHEIIQQEKTSIAERMETHHYYSAVGIGVLLSDHNMSGFIESSDVPNMKSLIFTQLDRQRSGKISEHDVIASLKELRSNVVNVDAEINALDREIEMLLVECQRKKESSESTQQKECVIEQHRYERSQKVCQQEKQKALIDEIAALFRYTFSLTLERIASVSQHNVLSEYNRICAEFECLHKPLTSDQSGVILSNVYSSIRCVGLQGKDSNTLGSRGDTSRNSTKR